LVDLSPLFLFYSRVALRLSLVWLRNQHERLIHNSWLYPVSWTQYVRNINAWIIKSISNRCSKHVDYRTGPTGRNCFREQVDAVSPPLSVTSRLWSFCRLVNTRSQIIFSDRHLNSWNVVHLNIYQNFLMTAVKMHEYLKGWGTGRWIQYSFLRGKFWETIRH
jgi:hypothetical protein